MNEFFIINTIYRYLEKNKLNQSVVKKLKDFPIDIVEFICKLSQLAFIGLKKNQLVFAIDEIKEICPEIDNIPGAINSFGLLQAVQHYPRRGVGRTTSVNFLHFTMQEYLAALHVSNLSIDKQLSMVSETIWNGQFNFMWMMYVGTVGVKSSAFASFINNYSQLHNIYTDKRKCLHLFLCYSEAKSDAEMPKAVSSIFSDGEITLNDVTLLPHHISSLLFFMSTASTQQWKILELGNCNLRDIGMNSLLEHIVKDNDNISTLEYVDLSGNGSSPWGLYCAIIRHCCGNTLTLCGDEGMKRYVISEVIDSLQINRNLQSLTLCATRRNNIDKYKYMSVKASRTNRPQNILVIDGKLHFSTLINDDEKLTSERVVNTKILYDCDGEFECLPEIINLSNKWVNDDTVCLVIFGLYNSRIVKILDLSCNNITDDGVVIISDWIKQNNTLKTLDLSRNKIGGNGIRAIIDCLKHKNTLQELKLSQNHIKFQGLFDLFNYVEYMSLEYIDFCSNSSSPWYVYCVIIKHCCVNSLILCGDEGMKEYVETIKDSLQRNLILESLTLCKIGKIGIQSIESIFVDNSTLKELNVSWGNNADGKKIIKRQLKPTLHINILCDYHHEALSTSINLSKKNIDDDAVYVMAFGLYNNTRVQELDVSYNEITNGGIMIISDSLKHNNTLQKLNISHNNITDDGAVAIMDYLKHNRTLKELNLSHNLMNFEAKILLSECIQYTEYVDLSENQSSPWGIYCVIIELCCVKSLTLCGDEGMREYVRDLTDILQNNVTLESLTLCKIGKTGVKLIEAIFVNDTTLKELNLSWGINSNGITILRRPLKGVSHSGNGMYVNILYDNYHDYLSKSINLSNKNIDDDAVYVIAFGLYNNPMIEKLDLSCNCITDNGAQAITDCLKSNTTLKKLNLSCNLMNLAGIILLSECVKHADFIDFSGNISSPWDGYCTIIAQCCTSTLTLSGDEGMKEYFMEVMDSLKINTMLHSLILHSSRRNIIRKYKDHTVIKVNNTIENNLVIDGKLYFSTLVNDDGSSSNGRVVNIKIYDDGSECLSDHETIGLAYSNIDDDSVCLITFCLYNNTTIRNLDLSHNVITDDGVVIISDCLKYNSTLEKLDISYNIITDNGAEAIGDFLKHNKTVKMLNLSHNIMSYRGITILSRCINYAENVDLSGNKSSPWGGYCIIIRHCYVKNLSLFGSEGMNECFLDIKDSLQTNKALQSLTLCASNKNTDVVKAGNTKKTVLAIDGKLCFNAPINNDEEITDKRVVNIKIIYDNDCECLLRTISLPNNNVNDDTVCLLAFGLFNNTIITKLDLSCNNIGDAGAVVISECLKHNNTLKKLNISHNRITDYGAVAIGDFLKHNETVKELSLSQNVLSLGGIVMLSRCIKYAECVDLSGNKSSPWDGYCTIIRHCCVGKLMLFGYEGMENYLKEATHSLQVNTTLHSLTLCAFRNNVGIYEDMVAKISNTKSPQSMLVIDGKLNLSTLDNNEEVTNKRMVNVRVLYDNDDECLPEVISLSNNNVNDDTICLITFGLYNNTSVVKLDISCNNITDVGAMFISDCLNHNNTLQTLNISHNQITANGMIAFGNCLKHNNTLKELDLSQNDINFRGMSDLSEYIRYASSLEYIDLSGNQSSPWGVYCAIIRYYCVNSLTLCGDKGMKEYVKEITDSLQTNEKLQSLTLCKIGRIGLQSIKHVVSENTTLKKLNLSWISRGAKSIHRSVIRNKSNSSRVVLNSCSKLLNISILYDSNHECSSEVINMSNEGINDDAVFLVIFGLHNNTTVHKLDFSFNNITNDGAVRISRYLMYNHRVKYLNLSYNHIHFRGMYNYLLKYIKGTIPLTYVDLSGNNSSPWSVYCIIIKHCCGNSLTLCGDEGMKEHIEEITNNLQTNPLLQSLTLCKIGRTGLESFKSVLDNNTTLKELNVSWISKGIKLIHRKLMCHKLDKMERVVDLNILYDGDHKCSCEAINLSNEDISDDAAYVISFGLHSNVMVQVLDLSCNKISNDGVVNIIESLRNNYSLCILILSKNNISYKGACAISKLIQANNTIWKLDISHNTIRDDGAIDICESLKVNNSLQDLNLSEIQITSKGAKKISEAISVNKGLHKLDISQNAVYDDGVAYISDGLKNNNTLLELNVSKSEITNKGGIAIAEAIQTNMALQKLDLSHNNISDDGVILVSGYLKENNVLKELILSNTNVSKEGLKIVTQTVHSVKCSTIED